MSKVKIQLDTLVKNYKSAYKRKPIIDKKTELKKEVTEVSKTE